MSDAGGDVSRHAFCFFAWRADGLRKLQFPGLCSRIDLEGSILNVGRSRWDVLPFKDANKYTTEVNLRKRWL